VTGLLPQIVEDAVRSESVFSASETFGVVALVVLVVLMIEHEAVRVARASPARMRALSAVIAPLLLVVMLTVAVRIAEVVT
jgi:hypothetical protein